MDTRMELLLEQILSNQVAILAKLDEIQSRPSQKHGDSKPMSPEMQKLVLESARKPVGKGNQVV